MIGKPNSVSVPAVVTGGGVAEVEVYVTTYAAVTCAAVTDAAAVTYTPAFGTGEVLMGFLLGHQS
eukprot:CAMPEP_0171624042 /NCGR_PEP_ID=MMETSP0990-20121206/18352_1 /TAXON_ID=483369 /ORGANISM="non described non described, Strain CCMP2098" /LENGTH=64 /DNA_ID=CAMNT_0012190453 /DNA_START=433 /DNA_END=627 /DNA_ORIENTATION=-